MVKLEDILFWIFIMIIVGTALWLLSGSPPEMSAIITIGLAVAGSELMIWKKIFEIDKKTAVSFIKLKSKIDNKFNNIENKIDKITNKLDNLKN